MDGRGAESDEHQTEGAVGKEAESEGLGYKTVSVAAVNLVRSDICTRVRSLQCWIPLAVMPYEFERQ